jgi:hypothetical protein
LNYSFETGDNYFSHAGDIPVIEGYRMSYLHHFRIIINQSIFWLMILKGFSRYLKINENAERIRNEFYLF